ncbi:ABC transporter permease [Gryllotalpicola kribbensis]|jgi:ABC-2 type transport system permease protein|uniref:Transport permease protein n=1 Tax=Gryllotalpicola kribbensis TaxID=993084 RepID=A0ABP8ARY3_9MICO
MTTISSTRIVPASERKLKNHTSVRQTFSNSLTMAYRGLVKFRRTPEQFFDVTLQPILFTVMFTFLFGGAVTGTHGDISGYLPTIIPGVLAQTVITASVVTGVQLREDMDKGVFDRFRSLPIARIAPLAGALTADTLRYAIATTITFLTGLVIGWRPEGGFLGLVLAGLLIIAVAWAISWIFAFFGVIARTASSVQGISFMVLFPLTFLSNAYVPTATMPNWLRWFADVNPVSHVITAMRNIVAAQPVGADVWWTLLGAAVLVLVFAPLTVRAYMRKA